MNTLMKTGSVVLACVALMTGCSIGKTSTLFVTKTNFGLEASTQPPTVELDYSRLEGVVGPQFERGKKLPVLASFRFRNSDLFRPAVGSTFATGDAALGLAAIYADETPLEDWQARALMIKAENSPIDSTLQLQRVPSPGRWFPWDNGFLNPEFSYQEQEAGDVKPVFFGTDTSLGLKIAWTGMTGQVPDTMKFGYNRKELALVPITMERIPGTTRGTVKEPDKAKMKMASLLATVDSGVSGLTNPDGSPALGYGHIQYFATGEAATLLSLQEDVRKAMLARLDPNREKYKNLFEEGRLDDDSKSVAFILLHPLYVELVKLEDTDPLAKAIAARMDSLKPAGLQLDFSTYQYDSKNANIYVFPDEPLQGRGFTQVHSYYTKLEESIKELRGILAKPDSALKNFQGQSIGDLPAKRRELLRSYTELTEKKAEFENDILRHATVLNDAVDFFYR